MGKWATYQKRGGGSIFGQIAAPGASSYSVGTITTTTIPLTRVDPIPTGADSMVAQAWNVATGLPVLSQTVGSGALNGLTTGTQYRFRVAWFRGAVQVSDWSPTAVATTL